MGAARGFLIPVLLCGLAPTAAGAGPQERVRETTACYRVQRAEEITSGSWWPGDIVQIRQALPEARELAAVLEEAGTPLLLGRWAEGVPRGSWLLVRSPDQVAAGLQWLSGQGLGGSLDVRVSEDALLGAAPWRLVVEEQPGTVVWEPGRGPAGWLDLPPHAWDMSQGQFFLKELSPGRWTLRLEDACGRFRVRATAAVHPGAVTGLFLEPGRWVLTARCREPGGRIVPAEVWVARGDARAWARIRLMHGRRARAGTGWRALAPSPRAGEHILATGIPWDPGDGLTVWTVAPGRLPDVRYLDQEALAGASGGPLDIVLRRGWHLRCRILDPEGQPARVDWSCHPPGGVGPESILAGGRAEDGRIEARLPWQQVELRLVLLPGKGAWSFLLDPLDGIKSRTFCLDPEREIPARPPSRGAGGESLRSPGRPTSGA